MERIKKKIKGLFSTPKRAAITIIAGVFAIGVIAAGGAFAAIVWDLNEDRVEYALAKKLTSDPEPAASKEAVAPPAADSAKEAPSVQMDVAYPKALNEKKISQEKAEEIALADAGFEKSQVTNLYSYYEMDDGYHQYDVRFFQEELEYEYAIDADSGAVMERDMDHIYD